MKIGIVAPPWAPVPPPGYGGTESVVDRLARGFVSAGHEVLLWTTGDSTCPVPTGHVFDQAQGDRIGDAAVELRHLIRGYEALELWGADIVHDHTLIGPLYARHRPGVRVVTTNHGPFNGELFDLYRTIADTVPVIAISHDQASRVQDVRITAVIHHGLDPEMFFAGDGQGDEFGPYFAFLGRMAPDKGVDGAARIARAAGVRLLIAAKMREPNERRFFHENVEPLLDERITYLGEVDAAERLRLLGGARALINPIRWPEPFGLVMIEALACGTPILSLREGSAPELIDDGVTGFICDSLEELTQRIDQVGGLDRAACRGVVEQRFSTQRMVADHLDLFERILADQRAEVGG
jgi:glycosyltransferase involved in cell wall biosynthesis